MTNLPQLQLVTSGMHHSAFTNDWYWKNWKFMALRKLLLLHYYKCQDLSDAITTVAGAHYKIYQQNATRLLSQGQYTISQQETVPDFCQPNDWQKRWDLVSRRNVSIEEAALVCGSRLFHARAAATGNAWSPRVDRWVDSTSNVGESTERRWRRATISDVSRGLSTRYAGAVPCIQRYTRTHDWNWIRSGTRNQYSSRSSGVVCSDVRRE